MKALQNRDIQWEREMNELAFHLWDRVKHRPANTSQAGFGKVGPDSGTEPGSSVTRPPESPSPVAAQTQSPRSERWVSDTVKEELLTCPFLRVTLSGSVFKNLILQMYRLTSLWAKHSSEIYFKYGDGRCRWGLWGAQVRTQERCPRLTRKVLRFSG